MGRETNNTSGPGGDDPRGPLVVIEATYRALDAAAKVLEGSLGVPTCVEACGKCCMVNVPVVWRSEAHFLASWLMGQGAEAVDRVVSRCEGWLLDREPFLVTGVIDGVRHLSSEEQDRIRPEVDKVMMGSPCPFLAGDKTCMVHEARPLSCRAYGVMRLPDRWCPRPLSAMETEEARGHISEQSALGAKARVMVGRVAQLSGDRMGARFLPTALYELFAPGKLAAYAADGLIASAKLVVMQRNTSILFQRDLNAIWAGGARQQAVTPGSPDLSGVTGLIGG